LIRGAELGRAGSLSEQMARARSLRARCGTVSAPLVVASASQKHDGIYSTGLPGSAESAPPSSDDDTAKVREMIRAFYAPAVERRRGVGGPRGRRWSAGAGGGFRLAVPPRDVDPATVLAALPDPVIVIDDGNFIVWVNNAGEHFLEASAATLRGCALTYLLPEDSPAFHLVEAVRRSGSSIAEYSVPIETATARMPTS